MGIRVRAWGFTLLAAVGLVALSGCSNTTDGEGGAAGPEGSKKIVIAHEASFPPMEFIDDSGEMVGFDIDVIRAVADAAGLKVEHKNVAWDGIFGALKTGEADVIASSVTITDERKNQFDFTQPYYKAGQSLLVRKGDESKYPNLEALKGKSIGVQIGTTGSEYVTGLGDYTLKQYNTAGMAIIDLANGQLDAVIIDKPVAEFHAAKKPEFRDKVVVVGEPQTEESFGFVVRKGDKELLDKLNAGLKKVEEDGTLEKLEQKWFR